MTKPIQSKNTMSWWLWLALVATLFLTYQMYLESSREEADSIEVISEAKLSNERTASLTQPPKSQAAPVAVGQAKVFTDTQLSNKTENKSESTAMSHSDSLGHLASRDMIRMAHSSTLFLPKQWLPPPPPVKAVVPPAPTAPPLPFVYVGEMDEMPTGKKVILMAQQKMHIPMLGEKVMGVWRLDKVDANLVYFTYLPLNLVKTLSKSAKSSATNNLGLGKTSLPPTLESPNL